ncbi:gustatory receptor [Homalodisca vitripennis]|nr:gustatory receptor [Homalodisca vitripennis]
MRDSLDACRVVAAVRQSGQHACCVSGRHGAVGVISVRDYHSRADQRAACTDQLCANTTVFLLLQPLSANTLSELVTSLLRFPENISVCYQNNPKKMKTFPDKIIWFCRIVGGLPLESATETRGTKALAFSNTAFLWSTTLVILQEIFSSIVLYMYFIGRQHGLLSDALTRTTDFATTLQVVSLQVTVAVVFFSSSRKYQRLVEVFDTLERIYRDHQCKKSEVKLTVKLWGIYTTAVILATAVPIIHDGILSGRKLSMSLANIFLLLPYCSEVAVLVQFTHVTQIITKCFRMVNASIKKELISHAIERMEINSSLPNVEVTHANRTMLSKVKKLRTLMNTYWMLCDAVHQANVFYGDQLMAVIFTAFVLITITSYYFFLYFGIVKVLASIKGGAWILIHICYVVVLINSNTDVINSADETGTLIAKFMNKDLDPIVKIQLEGFLLQLPHQNARFCALGYFPIHNETLTAMAGAVATYLVILIQFQTQPSSI